MPPKPPVRTPRVPIKHSVKPPIRTPSLRIAQPTQKELAQSKQHPNPQSGRPRPAYRGRAFVKAGYYTGVGIFSFAFCIFLRDNLVSFDTVIGSSMAPTLSPYAHETGQKDWILLLRNLKGDYAVRRGDVVTLWKPHRPNEISIKRVIAMEGDTVFPWRGYALDPSVVRQRRVDDGWDGLPKRNSFLDEDSVDDGHRGEAVEVGKVVVPKGHVWIEGDNWRNSFDSLDFGPLSLGLVEGKAARIWRGWFGFMKVGDERERVEGKFTRVEESEGVMDDG